MKSAGGTEHETAMAAIAFFQVLRFVRKPSLRKLCLPWLLAERVDSQLIDNPFPKLNEQADAWNPEQLQ